MAERKRALIVSLGCKVNRYESEAFAERLRRAGVDTVISEGSAEPEASGKGFDICIVNTCSVTGEADRKSGQIVRRMAQAMPGAKIIVTGCSAQANPERYERLDGVAAVVGNGEKGYAAEIALADGVPLGREKTFCRKLGDEFEPMSISGFDRARAYIKIEDGCESNCAYCVIPSLRGKIRSKKREDAVLEASRLIASGCGELVLTGIETSAYQYGLAELISEIDRLPGLLRLRLGSLDPASVKNDFINFYAACAHTMPHLHLSVQSGCDRTLFAMRRRYNTVMVAERMSYIKSIMPDAAFSADVICGFPGETDADFEETVKFFTENEFLHLHIFPYSPRPGTAAASMKDQVPRDTAKARCAVLSETQSRITEKILSGMLSEGKRIELLVETVRPDGDGVIISGHTPEFIEVKLRASSELISETRIYASLRGRIIEAVPVRIDGQTIIAAAVS